MNYITLIFLNIFVKLLNISFIFFVSFVGSLDFELKMRTQKCIRTQGKGLFHGCSEFNSRRNANQTFRPATHTKTLKWFQQTRYSSTINPKWLQMMQLIAKIIVLLLDTPTLYSKTFPFLFYMNNCGTVLFVGPKFHGIDSLFISILQVFFSSCLALRSNFVFTFPNFETSRQKSFHETKNGNQHSIPSTESRMKSGCHSLR